MAQYTQDYDERLPLAADGTGGSGLVSVMNPFNGAVNNPSRLFAMERSTLQPYLKSTQIFVCPSDTAGQARGLSYALNACVAPPVVPANGYRLGRSLAYFDNTAQWLFLAEEQHAANPSTDDGLLNIQFVSNALSARHLDGSNVAFLDGHVKWLRPEKVLRDGLVLGGSAPTPMGTACPA